MTAVGTAPAAAADVRGDWDRLSTPTADPTPFTPGMAGGMPEPARRWLIHAIAPGTSLWRSVEFRMSGQIRLGAWQPFTATHILAPPEGFIWAATARVLGLPVAGYDRLSSGTGQMRWRLLGIVPVMSADGTDVTRSAAGRLAGEAVLIPTTFREASWSHGDEGDRAVARWRIGEESEGVQLHVGPQGQLLGVLVQRWGNPNGAPYGRYPFGVTVEEEDTFAGITIPSVFRAGWWWGTDRQSEGEFFRARITAAAFR